METVSDTVEARNLDMSLNAATEPLEMSKVTSSLTLILMASALKYDFLLCEVSQMYPQLIIKKSVVFNTAQQKVGGGFKMEPNFLNAGINLHETHYFSKWLLFIPFLHNLKC